MTSLMVSMTAFIAGIKDRFASEKGATAVEYGLMVALIVIAAIVGITLVGRTCRRCSTPPSHAKLLGHHTHAPGGPQSPGGRHSTIEQGIRT